MIKLKSFQCEDCELNLPLHEMQNLWGDHINCRLCFYRTVVDCHKDGRWQAPNEQEKNRIIIESQGEMIKVLEERIKYLYTSAFTIQNNDEKP